MLSIHILFSHLKYIKNKLVYWWHDECWLIIARFPGVSPFVALIHEHVLQNMKKNVFRSPRELDWLCMQCLILPNTWNLYHLGTCFLILSQATLETPECAWVYLDMSHYSSAWCHIADSSLQCVLVLTLYGNVWTCCLITCDTSICILTDLLWAKMFSLEFDTLKHETKSLGGNRVHIVFEYLYISENEYIKIESLGRFFKILIKAFLLHEEFILTIKNT